MASSTDAKLIDRVDQFDQPIGTVRRGSVPQPGTNFRTVHVFIWNADGQLLLQRIAPQGRHPGRWGSSVAAYVLAGESYEAAARRRAKEELGLDLELKPLVSLCMHDDGSLKFVHLFGARRSSAENHEPSHLDALEFWDPADIRARILGDPEAFTPTFRALYERTY